METQTGYGIEITTCPLGWHWNKSSWWTRRLLYQDEQIEIREKDHGCWIFTATITENGWGVQSETFMLVEQNYYYRVSSPDYFWWTKDALGVNHLHCQTWVSKEIVGFGGRVGGLNLNVGRWSFTPEAEIDDS